MCQKSRTPLVHSIFLYHSETWSHKPASQAPGLGSFIANCIVWQVNVRKSLVDFQCFGKGLWTKTMSIHVKPENLQGNLPQYIAMSTTTQWSLDHEVKIKRCKKHCSISVKKICKYTLHLLGWNFSLALQVSELSPPSHLHLPPIPFQRLLERSSGPTPEHLSNTANVSEVSNTTGTPLYSIFVHHFKTWSHRPPVPNIRPLLLPCQCDCCTSWCS